MHSFWLSAAALYMYKCLYMLIINKIYSFNVIVVNRTLTSFQNDDNQIKKQTPNDDHYD